MMLTRLAFAVSMLLSAVLDAERIPPRPNVLFIAADDLRVDLGCYGNQLVKTPHLDRLAAEGLRFNRAYCQQALCNPSRASLMTGLRPDTLKLWNLTKHFRDQLPEVVTLPQHFKNNGYFTQNIGKIFHNWRTEIEGDPKSWSVPAVMHFDSHGNDRPLVEGELPPDETSHPRTEARDVEDEAYFDGRIAKLSIAALRERKDANEPFFLAVGFWKPHLPFNAPRSDWNQYQREQFALPSNPNPPENFVPLSLHDGRELLRSSAGQPPGPEDVRELRHGYYAAITYMDRQIGKVLDELQALDLRKNTIVVFWSDHGFHLGEHGLWCKTSNFELDARIPLILAPPNYERAGAATDSLTELLDLYPTLVDLCGLPKRADLEGVSLRPILEDPSREQKGFALTQHPRPAYYTGQPDAMGYSLRDARYRYTEWRDWKTGRTVARELYDHTVDPEENRNVAESNLDLAGAKSRELRRRFGLDPNR